MHDTTTTVPCHVRTVRGLSEPIVFVQNGKVFASSEDVAAYFGKQHSVVLRAIRALIDNDKSCACNFAFTQRDVKMPSGGTRPVAVCNMNRDGFTLLAMGFTGKRALAWKLKYIEAFNRMEAELARKRAGKADRAKADDTKASRAEMMPVDRFDAGYDLLLTAETALRAEGWLDRETADAICHTIERGLKCMRPLRPILGALR